MAAVYEKNLVEIHSLSPRLYFRKADLVTRGQCNGAYLVGEGAVGAVDVPTLEGAEEMKAEARELFGRPISYIFLTHGHEDHVGGLPRFLDEEVTVVCSERLAGELAIANPGAKASFVGIGGRLRFWMSGMEVECLSFGGKAHSPGDMVIRLPGERCLCTGDLAVDPEYLYFHEADIENWIDKLTSLAKGDEELVIPGHGEVYPFAFVSETARFLEILLGAAGRCLSEIPDTLLESLGEPDIKEAVARFLEGNDQDAKRIRDRARTGAQRELRMVLRYLLYKRLR